MDRRRQVEADWQKKLRAEAEVRRARASTEAALQALEQQAGSREEGVTRPIEDEPDDKTAVAQGDVAAPSRARPPRRARQGREEEGRRRRQEARCARRGQAGGREARSREGRRVVSASRDLRRSSS